MGLLRNSLEVDFDPLFETDPPAPYQPERFVWASLIEHLEATIRDAREQDADPTRRETIDIRRELPLAAVRGT
jgi:hypothetical protein